MRSGVALRYAGPLHSRPVARQRNSQRPAHLLFLAVAAAVFVVSAGALVLPTVSGAFSHAHAASPVKRATVAWTRSDSTAAAPLSASDLAYVLAHAGGVQADDALVQVRPGVFAKQSNVSGLTVSGRTVYYDVTPHQSFGPLRTGKWAESDVDILNRSTTGATQVVVYAPKR